MACKRINDLPLDVFKVLIETHGFDVNAQDKSKDAPIHLTIRNFNQNNGGDITVLRYLLNQSHIHTKNLLHYAYVSNHSFSRGSVELNRKYDTISCQIVEVIVEICIQQILDEIMP
jgi:ankyrin repeat protein